MRAKKALELLNEIDQMMETRRLSRKKRKVLGALIEQLEGELGKAFRRQGSLFVKRLAELKAMFQGDGTVGVTLKQWAPIFAKVSDETVELFIRAWEEEVGAALAAGGTELFKSLGLDLVFGLENPVVVDYLERNSAQMVTNIDEETKKQLNRIITDGQVGGKSYDKIADDITSRYEEFAVGKPQEHIDSRAHLVAVTEVGNAYEETAYMAATDLESGGVPMEKMWKTVGDDRVSDGCQENEADGWIPISQAHSSGHQKPLRFPGCRCDEQYRVKR